LDRFWDLKLTKNAPKSSPRASQDALGARFLPHTASGDVFHAFLTPGNLENRAPVQAGARFSENQLFELGAEKGPQNDPKIDPKTTPRGSPTAKNDVQSRCSILSEFPHRFSTIFRPPKGSRGTPKTSQKGIKSTPRLRGASGEQFWSNLGAILGSFWSFGKPKIRKIRGFRAFKPLKPRKIHGFSASETQNT